MFNFVKEEAIKRIANGEDYRKGSGHATWWVGDSKVHVRYVSLPKPGGLTYAYNINSNTLKADYELWICGECPHYYLLPIAIVKEMYQHPAAYRDYSKPSSRTTVVSVDLWTHRAKYAHGVEPKYLGNYFCTVIPQSFLSGF